MEIMFLSPPPPFYFSLRTGSLEEDWANIFHPFQSSMLWEMRKWMWEMKMGNEYSPYVIEKQDPRAKNISKTM